MSTDVFHPFLTLAVVFFWLGLPLMQGLVLAELRRRGRHPELLRSAGIREHVLRSVFRASRPGVGLVVVAFVAWLVILRPSRGWSWGLGAEILVALLVLQLGLALFTVRFAVRHAASESPSSRTLLFIRSGVLALGWAYGLALLVTKPGGPGETLFSVLVLGIGLGILGINRITQASLEHLARLAKL